jgi:uncharacterized protein (DUF488 family)
LRDTLQSQNVWCFSAATGEPGAALPYAARVTPPALRTIGYEATTFDLVRDTLVAAGVRLLVDVRALAASRKAGFSKRLLAAGLAEAGIGYVHLQPLGTPKPGRDAVRRGDVATMQRLFLDHMTGDRPQFALAEAVTLARTTPTCLLCFERDHRTCHRALVAEMVAGETGQAIVHLQTPELFGS